MVPVVVVELVVLTAVSVSVAEGKGEGGVRGRRIGSGRMEGRGKSGG